MRILLAHNYYQQAGGEDQVFEAEATLLETRGHDVWRYTLHNDQIKNSNGLAIAAATLWNSTVYRDLHDLIHKEKIQIAHFHNTFPLISPAAYYAARAAGSAVIQTCHNYRLLCPNALFFRDGKVCENCLGQFIPWSGVVHRCYRGSQVASAVTATALTVHRAIGTWRKEVDVYIALTDFARNKLIQGGLPAQKVVVKPNFVDPDPGYQEGKGNYALFVGRLSPEKGIDLLLNAWQHLSQSIPLKIVGDGPLADQVKQTTDQIPHVEWLGRQPIEEVYRLMGDAKFLVFPSEWYEGLPRTIVESFAVGTPVIAPNLGSMSSLIQPGNTGLHFQPGDMNDLVKTVEQALTNLEQLTKMRRNARVEYEKQYTSESSYQQVMKIYRMAHL